MYLLDVVVYSKLSDVEETDRQVDDDTIVTYKVIISVTVMFKVCVKL